MNYSTWALEPQQNAYYTIVRNLTYCWQGFDVRAHRYINRQYMCRWFLFSSLSTVYGGENLYRGVPELAPCPQNCDTSVFRHIPRRDTDLWHKASNHYREKGFPVVAYWHSRTWEDIYVEKCFDLISGLWSVNYTWTEILVTVNRQ